MMRKRNKISNFIKINKIYKEKKTKSEEEILSCSSQDQKEEDYNWINDSSEKGELLKEKYLKYPFQKWESIINESFKLDNYDKNSIYQETVNKILEKEIYKNKDFKQEKSGQNIFDEFLKKLNINKDVIKKEKNIELDKIKHDFYLINIKKEEFLSIIETRNYMLRFDNNFNNLNEINYINIIGEIKNSPDNIDSKQKKRYFALCNYMNSKFKNQYCFTQYIFNVSYAKFWYKNFHIGNPCIIGYIPKLFVKEYINKYNFILENKNVKEIKTNDFDSKNLENKNTQKKEENEKIQNPENIDYKNLSRRDLINIKREIENNVIDLKRDFEDEEERAKEEEEKLLKELKNQIKELKRTNEDILLKKKRKYEDEEYKLKTINKILQKKNENDEEDKD
jgi:hypothetical protein